MNEQHKQINDAAPSSLNHLVGQRAVIAQVKTAIDAAFEDNSRFDDALLSDLQV